MSGNKFNKAAEAAARAKDAADKLTKAAQNAGRRMSGAASTVMQTLTQIMNWLQKNFPDALNRYKDAKDADQQEKVVGDLTEQVFTLVVRNMEELTEVQGRVVKENIRASVRVSLQEKDLSALAALMQTDLNRLSQPQGRSSFPPPLPESSDSDGEESQTQKRESLSNGSTSGMTKPPPPIPNQGGKNPPPRPLPPMPERRPSTKTVKQSTQTPTTVGPKLPSRPQAPVTTGRQPPKLPVQTTTRPAGQSKNNPHLLSQIQSKQPLKKVDPKSNKDKKQPGSQSFLQNALNEKFKNVKPREDSHDSDGGHDNHKSKRDSWQ